MITQKEEEKIHILSDTELYPQAVSFMRSINRKLPPTQINGLLNVSLGNNTYKELEQFADFQQKRSTWKSSERHIPDFYRRLMQKFKELEQEALKLIALRTTEVSESDREEIKMAFAREFIQHLLAENDYMIITHAFPPADAPGNRANNQERPRGDRRSSWSSRGETGR